MKTQIEQDAGSARASIYRVYNTGVISAKIAISFAQRLNVNPYYLTGETDENNGYSEETAERFLREKGYAKLLDDFAAAASPKKRAYRKKTDLEQKPEETLIMTPEEKLVGNDDTAPVNAEAEEAAPSEKNINTDSAIYNAEAIPESVADINNDSEDDLAEITEEDMIAILHSLFIRARVNKQADERLDKIKHMLVY